ncbi:MAG: hypothetical protein V7719_04100 [Psychroserpens sp.]|uniref:hypothetical protein n=1 Tax=Psychroserpens sp. TaxID=2020870 RepID=UPI0030015CAD
MDLTQHCKFCDHKIIDFKKGTLCSLINKKPDFQHKCGVIKLEAEFKNKIDKINIEYEAVLKTKANTYGHVTLYAIIGVVLILGGFIFGKYVFDSGVISALPIVIMGSGLAPLIKAFGPLNLYNTSLKIAKQKKELLDTICKMYGFEYDINITHLKDSLENRHYETDIRIRKTSNSYQQT